MSSWRKRATACKSNGNAMSALDRPGRKSSVAIVVMCSIGFMSNSNLALRLTLYTNFSRLELTEPKSAKIEYSICILHYYLSLLLAPALFPKPRTAHRFQNGSGCFAAQRSASEICYWRVYCAEHEDTSAKQRRDATYLIA